MCGLQSFDFSLKTQFCLLQKSSGHRYFGSCRHFHCHFLSFSLRAVKDVVSLVITETQAMVFLIKSSGGKGERPHFLTLNSLTGPCAASLACMKDF